MVKKSNTFVLYRHWLDSSGKEHKVKVKKGSISTLNKWAKGKGLKFRKDRSLFGGSYLGPSGEWYEADIAMTKPLKVTRLVRVRAYLKNSLGNKSQTMEMTESQIEWNRKNKVSSPYRKIIRL